MSQSGGDDKYNVITVYTCDICKVANFRTMRAAEVHEQQCRGPGGNARVAPAILETSHGHVGPAVTSPPAGSAPSSKNNAAAAIANNPPQPRPVTAATSITNPSDQDFVNRTLFKCHTCKLLFWKQLDAEVHMKTCDSPLWYSCSVCGVLRFPNSVECMKHEEVCEGPKPLPYSNLPLAERVIANNNRVGNGGEPGVAAGAAGANVGQAGPNAVESSAPQVNKTSGDCDDSSVEVISISSNSPPESQPPTPSSPQAPDQPAAADATASANEVVSEAVEQDYITVWTCDICNEKQFNSFDEAAEHEKTCTGVTTSEESKTATADVNERKALLSPILGDKCTATSKDSISKYYCAILESLNLVYKVSTGAVLFQCHYCSAFYDSSSWTLKRVGKSLPSMVLKHVKLVGHKGRERGNAAKVGCGNIPSVALSKILESESSKNSGKTRFEEFVRVYFESNRVVERKGKDDVAQLVVMTDEEFAKWKKTAIPLSALSNTADSGAKKKKQEVSPGKDPKAKRQKNPKSRSLSPVPPSNNIAVALPPGLECGNMGAKLHSDENGNQFYLPPLDGIPLVSCFSLKESTKLHSSYQTLLDQLEFFSLFPKLTKSVDDEFISQSVGVRCQNCNASTSGCCFRKLSSVSSIANDVVLMGIQHLVSCSCTEIYVKEELKTLTTKDADNLTDYCKLIAKLYSMVDKQGKSSSAVVWGDSPAVPKGYNGHPIDINTDLVTGQSSKPIPFDNKSSAQNNELPSMTKPVETA